MTWTWTILASADPLPRRTFPVRPIPEPNAGIVVPFTGNLANPIKGLATLTDAQIAQLEAGKWYVNIHTEANKPGEIRGQLVRGS